MSFVSKKEGDTVLPYRVLDDRVASETAATIVIVALFSLAV